MGYVYRFTDLEDNIYKYVGIVWSEKRELSQRIYEHQMYDSWCIGRTWKIEYVETPPICSRTDAEYMEAHFISLFHTGVDENGFNVKKNGWGISSFIPTEWNWREWDPEEYIAHKRKYPKLNNYRKVKINKYDNTADFKTWNFIVNHCIQDIYFFCSGARTRRFTWGFKLPEKYLNIYFKDGGYLTAIKFERQYINKKGKRFVYKTSEHLVGQYVDYVTKMYGVIPENVYAKKGDECFRYENYYDVG